VSDESPRRAFARLPFSQGELLSGVYEVCEPLGEGGMGVVFEAHDRLLARKVAIKVSHHGVDPKYLRREAQAMATVHHPSLTAAFAFGTHRAIDYLVMERLYGVTLRAHTQQLYERGETLSTFEVLDLLIALTDGLSALHRVHIAHRDIKPSNVVLAPGNRAVLMDLGLFVKEAYDGSLGPAGSPAYMAPEVMTDESKPGGWHLADLYSLGVMAYELLTTARPYRANDIATLREQHATRRPIPLNDLRPDLPQPLATLVEALLAIRPADRPESAEFVLRQLRKVRIDLGASMHHDSGAPRPFTVLIVDDDPALMAVMAATVSSVVPGARIVTASDGRQALEMVRRTIPDVVLLDLYMPNMSGIEVCMHLRATRSSEQTRIVSVSGRAQIGDVQLLQQLGIVHFVTKGPELRTTLAGVLQLAHRAYR
jgi:serine/threonine-protein kinase